MVPEAAHTKAKAEVLVDHDVQQQYTIIPSLSGRGELISFPKSPALAGTLPTLYYCRVHVDSFRSFGHWQARHAESKTYI